MARDCSSLAVFLEADSPFVNGVCGKILLSPPNGGGRTASYYGVLGFRTRSPMARTPIGVLESEEWDQNP